MRKREIKILNLLIFPFLCFLIFSKNIFSAEIPKLINFQGKLTDSEGNPVVGTKRITFSIYDSETGGKKLWEETQDVDCDSNGLYNVNLGENSPLNLDFNKGYYLEITIDGEALTPRYKLTNSPYSFYSLKSSTANYALISAQANQVDWNNISNIPSGFADGVDDVGTIGKDSIGGYQIIDSTITDIDISPAANISASKLESKVMIEGENISLLNNDAGYITGTYEGFVSTAGDKMSGQLDLGNYALIISSSIIGVKRIEWADGTVQVSSPAAGGDNLGNHIATKNLNMQGFGIINTTITFVDGTFMNSTSTFLGKGEKALDSDKLDGLDSTAFQLNLNTPTWKAADSDKLDGRDYTAFVSTAGDKMSGQLDLGNYALIISSSITGVKRIEWADGTVQVSSPAAGGDNLGNHIATKNLNMQGFGIINTTITFVDGTFMSSTSTFITGTGTTNKIAKFTGSTSLGDSNIEDTGSLITLQGTSVDSSVNKGAVYINNLNTTGGRTILGLATNGTQKFRFDNDGDLEISGNLVNIGKARVGGGDYSTPTEKFEVFGIGSSYVLKISTANDGSVRNLSITNSGRVVIGEPGSTVAGLTVADNVKAEGYIYAVNYLRTDDGGIYKGGTAASNRYIYLGNQGTGNASTTTIKGDLRINGNDILDSGGNAAISFDGSQNVAVAGNLEILNGNLYITDDNNNRKISWDSTNLGIGISTRTIVSGQTILNGISNEDVLKINKTSSGGGAGIVVDNKGTGAGIYMDETGAGTPDHIIVKTGGSDVFVLDNSGNLRIEGTIYDITDNFLTINDGVFINGKSTITAPAGTTGDILTISTGTTKLFRFQADGHAKSLVSFDSGGADYAEWFEKEEEINEGDIVGLNLETGKARRYREGDVFLGICSSKPGFIGNSNINLKDEEMKKKYVLVGLLGQMEVNEDQVVIEGRIVKTKDNKKIGYLLSNGKVFVR